MCVLVCVCSGVGILVCVCIDVVYFPQDNYGFLKKYILPNLIKYVLWKRRLCENYCNY